MSSELDQQLMQAGRMHQSGDLASAETLFRKILESEPSHFDALHGLGIVCYQRGNLQEASALIIQASALRNDDPVCLNNLGMVNNAAGDGVKAENYYRQAISIDPAYADAWFNLARLLRKNGDIEASLQGFERALQLNPSMQQAVEARDEILHADVSSQTLRDLFILSTSPEGLKGDFRGLKQRLADQRGDRRLLVLAAAPKTASTWLANLLSNLTHFPYINLSYAFLQNEHDLYPPAMLAYNQSGAVSQLHMKGTLPTARLLQFFDSRPIVMFRRLDDVVASLYDQFENTAYLDSPNSFSFACVDANYATLDSDQKVKFITRMMLPWFVQHYHSWKRLEFGGEINPVWLSYDDVTQDTKSSVYMILEGNTMLYDEQQLDQVIGIMQSNKTRVTKFNRGIAGRGKNILTKHDIDDIIALTKFYPNTDFSHILPA